MAKIINSQALEPANKALGIAGSGDSETELLDGDVNQTLDIIPIARRGGTLAGTDGIFRVALRTIHTDSEVLSVSWQPYLSAAAGVVAPFPSPVPDTFDVWLLGAALERVSAGGTITQAVLRMTQIQQGFGIDDTGAAVASTSVFALAFWDLMETAISPGFGNVNNNNYVWQRLAMRIPRKGAIASPFISFTCLSATTITVDCVMMVGLFPVALGQDVLV